VWVKNSGGADWVPRGPYKFIFMAVCAAATTNKNTPLIGNRALPENQPRSGNEVTLAVISGQISTIQECRRRLDWDISLVGSNVHRSPRTGQAGSAAARAKLNSSVKVISR